MRRTFLYASAGGALALGAPVGWLALRLLEGGVPAQDLLADRGVLAYMLIGTSAAFTAFGAVLGRAADRERARSQSLDQLSRTDALTGLANVRAFRERLELERARAQRSGAPLSLVMVDLDHFKRVNDRHGHGVGDQVLARAAALLKAAIREVDLAARVGGEEFAVLCPGASRDEAASIAERARAAIAASPLRTDAGEVTVTASFGVAALDGTGDALVAAADAALYAAKREGRNRVALG